MNTNPHMIQIPPPDQIREQLAATVAEARALRKLLKLSEAAARAEEARNRKRQTVRETEEGHCDE
jgi:hypothetical protein